jgi:recombination associated protein RdgC
MWFKNISCYRLPPDFVVNEAALDKALKASELRPLGPVEPARYGFVAPLGAEHASLQHVSAGFIWITLGAREKVLPNAVVKDACAAKIKKARDKTGKNPGKRQRDQIKDEVLLDLLPRAFEKSGRLNAYLDPEHKLLFVDSGSDKAAERVISALREGFGSFIAEPVQTEESPSAVMTQWLAAGDCPTPFALGDECQLVDPVDTACAVKAKRHDLTLDEIREHVKGGKKVSQLGLVYDSRLSLVLDDKFKLRKLKFLDVIQDAVKEVEGESDAISELETRFTLMALEVRRLLAALNEHFNMA